MSVKSLMLDVFTAETASKFITELTAGMLMVLVTGRSETINIAELKGVECLSNDLVLNVDVI